MTKQIGLVLAAALVGGLVSRSADTWLRPRAAYADGSLSLPKGITASESRDALVIKARGTTLTLAPDGTVRVSSPEKLLIEAAEDLNLEGYHVTIKGATVEIKSDSDCTLQGREVQLNGSSVGIDADSEYIVETRSVQLKGVYDYTVDADRIRLGDYGSSITLADGDDPVCLMNGDKVEKSERVKAR